MVYHDPIGGKETRKFIREHEWYFKKITYAVAAALCRLYPSIAIMGDRLALRVPVAFLLRFTSALLIRSRGSLIIRTISANSCRFTSTLLRFSVPLLRLPRGYSLGYSRVLTSRYVSAPPQCRILCGRVVPSRIGLSGNRPKWGSAQAGIGPSGNRQG